MNWDMTIGDYYKSRGGGQTVAVDEIGDEWEIESHDRGICLLSPGTDPGLLNYRDDSQATFRALVPLEIIEEVEKP